MSPNSMRTATRRKPHRMITCTVSSKEEESLFIRLLVQLPATSTTASSSDDNIYHLQQQGRQPPPTARGTTTDKKRQQHHTTTTSTTSSSHENNPLQYWRTAGIVSPSASYSDENNLMLQRTRYVPQQHAYSNKEDSLIGQ